MKRLTFVLLFFSVLLFVSCDEYIAGRSVTVTIPEHEWEIYSNARLWYTLKWNNGYETSSLHIGENERTITVIVPRNETVYICAYPLGDMKPFGCAVSPGSSSSEFELTQNDGYLCNLLMNTDRTVAASVNYPALRKQVCEVCSDFSLLDDISLIRDAINGKLRKSSLVIREKIGLTLAPFPEGIWVSDTSGCGRIFSDGTTPLSMSLCPGEYVWYCENLHMEMRVIVDNDGMTFCYGVSSRVNRNVN